MPATHCRRREYRPEAVAWEEIAPEAETGKQFLLRDKAGGVAMDHAGRPVLVLRPRWACALCALQSLLLGKFWLSLCA